MNLKQYQKRRKFEKTPEPKGDVKETSLSRFVVHDHWARHHHYDFRLELDGVLKSWAVPKGVPEERGVRRLAISVEDHPIEYGNFQGVIPEGQYGAGEVKIFDNGTFKLIKRNENEIEFKLEGEKLTGQYVLIRTKLGGKDTNWLIFKK